MCKVEQGSIIKSVFLYNFKCSNMEIGKTDESLRRKATGPVKGSQLHEMRCAACLAAFLSPGALQR